MTITREELLSKAEQLADIIHSGVAKIHRTSVKDVALGSMLSLVRLGSEAREGAIEEEHLLSLVPKVYEIILYGSVAAGKAEPSDIDLMIIDNGHFSDFLSCNRDEHHTDDLYGDLRENLYWLMGGWFEVYEEQVEELLGDTEVDLHVLPLRLLTNTDFRTKMAEKHRDPNFFKNALGEAMRFSRFTGKFEPFTLKYLENQYRCCLDDLR